MAATIVLVAVAVPARRPVQGRILTLASGSSRSCEKFPCQVLCPQPEIQVLNADF